MNRLSHTIIQEIRQGKAHNTDEIANQLIDEGYVDKETEETSREIIEFFDDPMVPVRCKYDLLCSMVEYGVFIGDEKLRDKIEGISSLPKFEEVVVEVLGIPPF